MSIFPLGSRDRGNESGTAAVVQRGAAIIVRTTFLVIGHLSVAAGVIGIFVPLWPTTPFLLLAAACYSRGSARFHSWLHSHHRLGPVLRAWHEHRAIPRHAKVFAVLSVMTSVLVTALTLGLAWGTVAAAGALLLLGFILSRPSTIPAIAHADEET